MKSEKIKEAMDTIKQAMIDDNPEEPGSYAHSWHCNIAMTVYDVLSENGVDNDSAHEIGNDAATRFMRLCFGVETRP